MTATIHIGFEVGSGEPVAVPVQHLAVTGQTQLSGKTTTLEALVARSGLGAIAFVTKRGEASFSGGHTIAPYFRERADWQFVSAVLEATLREKMRFERSWIMRACKGAKTLADVQRNVRRAMEKARGLSADVYMTLDHYLDIVIPQIERLPYSDRIDLWPGLNVMDLSDYTTELQALVIRSVMEWVYEKAEGVLVIIPEAWEFIPQQRGSPVLLACEVLIRKSGNLRNFVWLDSQDIAGVHKNILRQVGVWILGVQREANEVKRALAHVPGFLRKPKVDDVMGLERGQFFVCFGKTVTKVYVQPAWMDVARAMAIARGEHNAMEGQVDEQEARALRDENARLHGRIKGLEDAIAALKATQGSPMATPAAQRRALATSPPRPAAGNGLDMDAIYAEMKRRAEAEGDPGVLVLRRERPELAVHVVRRQIEASGETLFGRLAGLIADGFFDEAQTGNAAFNELKRRGASTAKPNVYRECDKLTQQGFLTKESGGYQVVKGMVVNIVERAA